MADRVPKITQAEKPTFDAAVYSDRLQETRQAPGALGPVQVFDRLSASSIVPLARYVAGKLTDTVNALSEFTAAHEQRLNAFDGFQRRNDARLDALEAARPPFGSGSG